MAARTILITGAAGFVGRAVCAAFAQAGLTVVPATRQTIGDIGPQTDWQAMLRGVEAVVIAGTDLNLVLDESSAQFPAFDCAVAHIEAIVDRMIGV